MKNVSASAFSSNLPINFKVYSIIQNPRQNVNKLLTQASGTQGTSFPTHLGNIEATASRVPILLA